MADTSGGVIKKSADNLSRLCGQQVSITFGNDSKQYFCFCWGMCKDKFFMTQLPVDSDIHQRLGAGNNVVIRFVESGMVCGFKTRILKMLTSPFRMIFFEYPESIDAVNLRHSKRVPIFLPATISWKDEAYDGTIRDLSEGGCFFEMTYWQDPAFEDLKVGSSFPIRFRIHGEESDTEFECRAVRIIRDQDDLRLGLSFGARRTRAAGKIADFVTFVSQLLDHKPSN